MSGGVDSSVAAALLIKQGYDVTGAFMKQFTTPTTPYPLLEKEGRQSVCPWKKDRRDALRVAAHLGIPLLTLDFEKEYRQWVMAYMFDEYKKGRTPNPDVMCNKWIKFGVWMDEARRRGFDYLATGHYANIKTLKHKNIKTCRLNVAKDANKDQTYFLHQLTQDQLKYTLFPIGGYLKSEVRSLARKFGLPTADREESMGICFVGEIPMKEFLQQKIKPKPGKMVLSSGEVVGKHDGLPFYTIGQRHFRDQGLGTRFQVGNQKPLYVVGKDRKKNQLIVGHEDDPLLWKKEIEVGEVNWMSGHPPKFPLQCKVRLRHRQKLQIADLRLQIDRLIVRFRAPQKAVTPGQFAVFYVSRRSSQRAKADEQYECLGGGVIL